MSKVIETVAEEVIPNLESLSESDRATYLKTGELPTPTKADGGVKPAESGAASAAAGTQEPKDGEPKPRETRSERRIRQLNDKIKALEAQISAKPGTETRIESKPAASTEKAPKWKSFRDQVGTKYANEDVAYEAYEDANEAFHVEQRTKAVAQALKTEQEALERTKAQTAAQKTTENNAKEFAKRAETFRKTLSEDHFQEHFMDVYEAVNEVMASRPEIGQIADALVESEVGPELVQYYGENPDEFDELLAMPIAKAMRELGKLEVSDKIKAPQPKTRTAAKRIGSGVGGGGASSADPVQAALEKGDVMAYIQAMNAQEKKEAAERYR